MTLKQAAQIAFDMHEKKSLSREDRRVRSAVPLAREENPLTTKGPVIP